MGLKSKNGKQSAISKKPTIPRPWPDLPPQLLNIVAKNSTLRKNICYGGNVTKSYRVPPKQCNPIGKSPFPQLITSGTDTYADSFYIPFCPGFYFRRWRSAFGFDPLQHIVGYSDGLLFGRGKGAVPSVPSMRFKEYLVESNGEILLVFLIVSRKSIRSVDNVEVYRLQFNTLSWVKMEGIGDRHCSWGLIVVYQSMQVKLGA
ncbi:hypothetical protein RHSIM_Rhsim05G0099500 [Rhododendron simsii]|uniref:KIB1-4 beta-propeller domain-containing protein n=1 Tax=Rhododendron simsii TaxID=118357 RepID=A0A834LMR9_RHOSS|nr:hypothetical protein RHSIM_Rhsim05G0099500 [Rhododendron simsii]